MIIKRLTATYGRLKNETLTLSPGLNVIVAPNESGKSTWCAFIRAMLYGVPTSDRDKAGYLSDKTRYRPWDGGAMEGVMELSCSLGDITLERATAARSPMKELRATYTGTGESVPGLTSETAGEALTGMTEAVFRRSAFIAQSAVRVDQTPELERRIAALVSTGDEHTSYSETDDRLREWQRRRRYKKSGEIPRLEERIASLDDELRRMEAAYEGTAGLRLEVAELTERKSELEREMTLHDSYDAIAKARRADDTLRSLESELEDAKTHRAASVYDGRDTDTIINDAERLGRRCGKPVMYTLLALSILSLLAFTLFYIINMLSSFASVLPLLTSASCFVIGAVYIPADRKLKTLLGEYGVTTIDELRDAVREYTAMVQAERDAEAALSGARQALEDTGKPPVAVLSDAPKGTRAETQAELNRVSSLLARRQSEYDMAQGAIRAIGDPAVLRGARLELEAELAEKTLQYDALTMAIDALSDANAQLQSRFAPMLGKEAERLLSQLTGGRYDGLVFDKSLTASARETGAAISRDALALSTGTADQIYLALRLAILKLVTPQGDPCPLILDDALTNFDDERAALAIRLLRDISNERQVILFTCHEREARS